MVMNEIEFKNFKINFLKENKISLARERHFYIGKIFKTKGADAAISELKNITTKYKDENIVISEFGPPRALNIVTQSRPFEEWPLFKANTEIQNYIYSLPQNEIPKLTLNKEFYNNFFKSHPDLKCFTEINIQYLNSIFKNSFMIREGVFTKVKNYNEKQKKKNLKDYKEKQALDENGHLNQKPGANKCIYFVQDSDVQIINISNKKHKEILEKANLNYSRNGEDDLKIYLSNKDRLKIKPGNPGYIPSFMRNNINPHKGVKLKNKTGNPILGILFDKRNDDWIIFDMRGLLRDIYYRHPSKIGKLKIKNILDYFTKDPVLYYDRKLKKYLLKFAWKPEKVGVNNKGLDVVNTFSSPKFIKKYLGSDDGCLVSIDLGVTNIAAINYNLINSKNSEEINSSFLGKEFLSNDIINKYKKLHIKQDDLNSKIEKLAIEKLSAQEQEEIKRYNDDIFENCKNYITDKMLPGLQIDWEIISKKTFFISSFIKNNLSEDRISKLKNDMSAINSWKNDFNIYANDYSWMFTVKKFLPKISENTRKNYQEKRWEEQRNCSDYAKISTTTKELARLTANYIVNQAKKISKTNKIILAIEDLNVGSSFFDGKGKTKVGLNIFNHKQENRWFVKALHKSLKELPKNKGIPVISAFKERTSITCIKCNFCDKKNRNGELFKCLKCGIQLNSDLDVACENIKKVALSGKIIPKPDGCEQRSAPKKSVTARNSKSMKLLDNNPLGFGHEAQPTFTDIDLSQSAM